MTFRLVFKRLQQVTKYSTGKTLNRILSKIEQCYTKFSRNERKIDFNEKNTFFVDKIDIIISEVLFSNLII